MTERYFIHHIHEQLIVINGKVGFFKNRSTFKLTRSDFIMTRFKRNTKLKGLCFEITHIRMYPFRDRTKIMIIQLLTFGWLMTKECSAGHKQVGTRMKKGKVDQEIFLFNTQGGIYAGHIFIKILTNVNSRFIQGMECF